jgi:hypothetical protein
VPPPKRGSVVVRIHVTVPVYDYEAKLIAIDNDEETGNQIIYRAHEILAELDPHDLVLASDEEVDGLDVDFSTIKTSREEL